MSKDQVIANQPVTLYRLRVIGGTHTQDELFLLSDKELRDHIEEHLGEEGIPTTLKNMEGRRVPMKTRRQVEIYLNALGYGIEKTYVRGESFTHYDNLSRKWPGKIALVGTGNATPPEYQIQAGETIQEFANRMNALAASDAQRKELEEARKHRISDDGLGMGSNQSDPVINQINQNRDMFPKSPMEQEEAHIPKAFEAMTVQQLRQYAEEHEISLEGCSAKAQIVRRLQGVDAVSVMGPEM